MLAFPNLGWPKSTHGSEKSTRDSISKTRSCVCPWPTAALVLSRGRTVFVYTLKAGFQHWQMGNAIALHSANDQIKFAYGRWNNFFLWLELVSCSSSENCRTLGSPENNRCLFWGGVSVLFKYAVIWQGRLHENYKMSLSTDRTLNLDMI